MTSQRKSQRFTVPTLPAAPPPMPHMPSLPLMQHQLPSPYAIDGRPPSLPRDVDSLASSDSSTSNPFALTAQGYAPAMANYTSPPSTAPSSYSPRSRTGTGASQQGWSRATLPPSWLADPEYAPAPVQPHYLPPGPSPGSFAMNGYPLPGQETEDDEVIPTAIVIKVCRAVPGESLGSHAVQNIPFSVPRDIVLHIMVRRPTSRE
jgi:hypothetical protein